MNAKLESYDKIISDKYEEHIEKGTDLLYEVGNSIKTELDLVMEESSENISNLKNSAEMKSIIEHARIAIENSWKPAHEQQSKTILAVRTSQNKLKTTQRNHEVMLQPQLDPPAHPDIKALKDILDNLEDGDPNIKSLEDRLDNLEDGDMYPTNLHLETQVNMRVEEALQEFKESMESTVTNALAEMHNHTNSNDLTNIKAAIASNMEQVTEHQNKTDHGILQIRKNIADHIESLVDKLHDQYMNPENPFTNLESESMDTMQMGAQPPPYPTQDVKPWSIPVVNPPNDSNE
jgi:hypothetical protein